MFAALTCPSCSAPLPAEALHAKTLTCRFCDQVLARPGGSYAVPVRPWVGRASDEGKPRLRVGKHLYVVDGEVGRGTTSRVFLGHRDAKLTERVVIHLGSGEPRSTWERLGHLEAAAQRIGAPLADLLPARVAGSNNAMVFRSLSGFSCTLVDVAEALERRLDPRHAVWMLARGAELLALVHRAGFVHRRVTPEHLLIHGRDHLVSLAGWSGLTPDLGRSARSQDVVGLARAVSSCLEPRHVPRPLWRVLADPAGKAVDLASAVRTAAREAFGPPAFVPFALPSLARAP